jgi:MATE family multidrug resistance protein
MGDEVKLAAIGLGNMIQNCLVISVLISLNSALETLVSQASGGGNASLCGLYLNRGKVVMTAAYVLLAGILLFTKPILLALGQDVEVSSETGNFMIYYMPGLYFWGQADLHRKFLNSMQWTAVPMLAYQVSVGLHFFWC